MGVYADVLYIWRWNRKAYARSTGVECSGAHAYTYVIELRKLQQCRTRVPAAESSWSHTYLCWKSSSIKMSVAIILSCWQLPSHLKESSWVKLNLVAIVRARVTPVNPGRDWRDWCVQSVWYSRKLSKNRVKAIGWWWLKAGQLCHSRNPISSCL